MDSREKPETYEILDVNGRTARLVGEVYAEKMGDRFVIFYEPAQELGKATPFRRDIGSVEHPENVQSATHIYALFHARALGDVIDETILSLNDSSFARTES